MIIQSGTTEHSALLSERIAGLFIYKSKITQTGKRVDIMNGITMMIIAIVVPRRCIFCMARYLQNKWGIDPKAENSGTRNGGLS